MAQIYINITSRSLGFTLSELEMSFIFVLVCLFLAGGGRDGWWEGVGVEGDKFYELLAQLWF